MPLPTGREIFEGYLSQLGFEDSDKPSAGATDAELREHFGDYLQDRFASEYPAPILERLTIEASGSHEVAAVRELL